MAGGRNHMPLVTEPRRVRASVAPRSFVPLTQSSSSSLLPPPWLSQDWRGHWGRCKQAPWHLQCALQCRRKFFLPYRPKVNSTTISKEGNFLNKSQEVQITKCTNHKEKAKKFDSIKIQNSYSKDTIK